MIAKNYIEFRFRLFWDTLYRPYRGTLVVYNAPARFTYWVPTCVWMIAGTIQTGEIKQIYTHPQLLCMHPYWASSLNFYLNLINFHFN